MKELTRFRQFLNESQEVKEGTWGYGSKDQMVKTLAHLDKISQMGGVKGSLELDKIDGILYNVFGDDSFHDAIDRAKDNAIDDDRFANAISDAQARGIEMMNAIHRTNEEMDVNIDSPKEDAEIGMTLPEIKGKMKKSELKEMIRAAFLNEAEDEEVEDVEVDTEEEIEDVDVDVDADVEDAGEVDVEDDAKVELTGDKKDVSDNLEAALEAARALGDEKLVDQIGNTITFFTRAHIVKEEKEEVNESFNRMQRLAGLIK